MISSMFTITHNGMEYDGQVIDKIIRLYSKMTGEFVREIPNKLYSKETK